jgi:hypothetical protein
MSPSIRVDDEVYGFLQRNAEAFVDTPNTVLRRLLKLGERDAGAETDPKPKPTPLPKAPLRSVRRGKRGTPGRARPGTILPHEAYVGPILDVLAEADGQATAREVTAEVGRRLSEKLTPIDLEPLPSGSIRWESRVQFVRLRLADEGLLARDTPRGVWALTPAGRDRAAESR